ncbi:TetR/AcrR family transcriptional regulator [Mannheimia varigena]|uniref:Transcriptional regulator AcrR n=1 Tax=Mannheimia varigena USDA-ARS-USMARC-1296 TaxID=1433287 RepID=W0Q9C5_9PAST|nr:TetR/AcrR family transcriptional regulator [Mannheimia varigena]AHG75484.1 transcriptional regulator AcrR [Mannheimia varigena USDA-ARS-USMARC-1296]AHG77532.1 transcriptional regulator AcrR [Mannheimia varigena USDA-ARS-USMARC-1312]AHG79798.1 transcriptional regulator AcrR [Mannheimia varigena USDA-ARS-USMARC-1388]AWW34606.1 TetR/AcrR family transcriptional regulator [Mannheimia varigena]MDY2946669.1 TetR/AcrR family transcriptional regulator [Mannheimia varigena]
MSRRIEPKEDMVNRIILATEKLIVQEGLQNLSMRNIAKEAGMASGTLYLYFKTKEDLLHCLATKLLECYHNYLSFEFSSDIELFQQYRLLVKKKWLFLNERLELVKQFQAFIGIDELIRETIADNESFWNKLIFEGKKQKIIANLPNELLYSLSIGTLVDIKYLQKLNQEMNFEDYLDEITSRTWKAITF